MSRVVSLFSMTAILVLAATISAQREAPAGASDRGPMDRSTKNRSAELERVKREAEKPDSKNQAPVISPEKFQEIKEDFEGLQLRQDEIRKIYSEGKQVDTAKIAAVAALMNTNATRLNGNLFPPPVEDPKAKKKSKEKKAEAPQPEPAPEPLPQDLKALIMVQDDTLAAFVSNPMFTNPTVSNVDSNVKAQADLKKLIRTTAALSEMAAKKP